MAHIEEIKDYWNQRAKGFSLAVEEELGSGSAEQWTQIFREHIDKAGADVLDDGTGAGFFPVILSRLGHRVTAIDYSDAMVTRAAERFAALGLTVETRQMDAQNLEFDDESFDVVVSRNVIWNLDDPAKAYSEIHRVLRPGGKVILDDGNIYLYQHDEAYAAAREKAMKARDEDEDSISRRHARNNVDNVDFSIIERIADELPMSYTRRPQWDFHKLVELGFRDIRVIIRGEDLPMGFLIVAQKRVDENH